MQRQERGRGPPLPTLAQSSLAVSVGIRPRPTAVSLALCLSKLLSKLLCGRSWRGRVRGDEGRFEGVCVARLVWPYAKFAFAVTFRLLLELFSHFHSFSVSRSSGSFLSGSSSSCSSAWGTASRLGVRLMSATVKNKWKNNKNNNNKSCCQIHESWQRVSIAANAARE